MEMIEERVSDARILRLIRKWINVGVVDEGRLLESETGTGQGQIISPLLANIYLHHVLDVWFAEQVTPRLTGKASLIRYADDALLFFQYRKDAQRALEVLHKRFAKFGLTLHPEKTRLVEFGRRAHERALRMKAKTATFDFLGLTHRCATSRKGKFTVHVGTMKKRLKRSLTAIADWCQQHRHDLWIPNSRCSTRNCEAITSTMGAPRTTVVFGSSTGRCVVCGASGWNAVRVESASLGRPTQLLASPPFATPHYPRLDLAVSQEEPAAAIPHGGICEAPACRGPMRSFARSSPTQLARAVIATAIS